MPTRVEIAVDLADPPAVNADREEEEHAALDLSLNAAAAAAAAAAATATTTTTTTTTTSTGKPKKKQLTLGNFFGKVSGSQPSKSLKNEPESSKSGDCSSCQTHTATAAATATETKTATTKTATAYTSQANQLDSARRSEIASICLGTKMQSSQSLPRRQSNRTSHHSSLEVVTPLSSLSSMLSPSTMTDKRSSRNRNKQDSPSDSLIKFTEENAENDTPIRPKTPPCDVVVEKPTEDVADTPNNSNNDNNKSSSNITQDPSVIPDTTTPAVNLSQESKLLLQKNATMRETYRNRANSLLQRAREGLPEEQGWSIPLDSETIPDNLVMAEHSNEFMFPDLATPSLAAIVEGRSESLTKLATIAIEKLTALYPTISFSHDTVTAKMKLLATRKNHVKNPHIITALSAPSSQSSKSQSQDAEPHDAALSTTNIFQDEQPDHVWRWEVTVLDLLPSDVLTHVKRARAAVKKIGAHVNATAKLLATLQETEQCILASNTTTTTTTTTSAAKLEKLLARQSQEEEKVLKYEREAEKVRLQADAKIQKEAQKQAQKQAEEQQKQAAVEAKKKQTEAKKKEVEAAKQKKKDEQAALKLAKEEAEAKQRSKQQALANKQKKIMSSFFVSTKKTAATGCGVHAETLVAGQPDGALGANEATGAETLATRAGTNLFDISAFRASIQPPNETARVALSSSALPPPFASLSHRAQQSRKRRTTQVNVPVTVTVYPDDHNPFAAQPYAEKQDLTVPNKCKFLSFKEDVRPPYYGTWSKQSTIVTGRNPFAKDTAFLDYDVDSEAEWEEGDDEVGEDLGDDDPERDDDADDVMGAGGDDEDDGWLAGEVDEELDDETKRLRQKQLGGGDTAEALKVCVIAPAQGGRPLTSNLVTPDKIEGFSPTEAMAVLERLTAVTVSSYPLFLGAFPPSEDAVMDGSAAAHANSSSTTNEKSTAMPSDDNMRIFARFVHNSTFNSKDKIVDCLLHEHKTVTSSRSQAIRVLDSIAEKKKKPTGTVWEVKKEVLDGLGLSELIESKCDTQHENMKKIALFVHHNTTSSKDKIVDDLRAQDESLTSSRAEAARILQQIADKKKCSPGTGYYWSVKPSVRQELGLLDVLADDPPFIETAFPKQTNLSSSGSSTDTITNAQTKTPVAPRGVSSKSEGSCGSKEASSASSSGKKSSGKKRSSLGSTKLLESFVKKTKTE